MIVHQVEIGNRLVTLATIGRRWLVTWIVDGQIDSRYLRTAPEALSFYRGIVGKIRKV